MQIGFKHNTKEWDQYITQVRKKFPDKLSTLVGQTTKGLARQAKASTEGGKYTTGRLKNAILTDIKPMTGIVYIDKVHYAPYVEFGTGSGFYAPSEMMQYASQFKAANPFTGRRKVNIKGVGWRMVQFPLNLKARPFFYPQFFLARDKFFKQVEKALKQL